MLLQRRGPIPLQIGTEIASRNIRRMRDVLAHGYFGISLEIVWVTATTRMDELRAAVEKLLG